MVISQNADEIDQMLALKLWETIQAKTGYALDAVDDSTAAVEREIVIGNTNRNGNSDFYSTEKGISDYSIQGIDGKLYISYSGAMALNYVEEIFHTLYMPNSSPVVNMSGSVNIDEYNVQKENTSDIRVMTSNTLAIGWGGDQDTAAYGAVRMALLADMYNTFMPDFIGLQEAWGIYGDNHTNQKYLSQHIDSRFKWVNLPDNYPSRFIPILYRSDLWQVVDCGSWDHEDEGHPWGYVWARFERIDNPNETFILFNLHYCGMPETFPGYRVECAEQLNAKIKQFQSLYPNSPIAVTGDYNAKRYESTNVFDTMLDGTGMETTYVLTDNSNLDAGEHPIDNIVIGTEDFDVVSHTKVDTFSTRYGSDHYSYFSDLRYKNN